MNNIDENIELARSEADKPQFLNWLTVEHILYMVIGLAATVLRFADLGQVPLSPLEAEHALTIYRFWHPDLLSPIVSVPAYFTPTLFLSQIAGFSDATVRIIPALFGVGIVFLPWFLRSRLGRVGALVGSLLMAVSPVLALIARTADGQSIALFAGMLLFTAWLRYYETKSRRWLFTLSGGLAVGLLSAPLFYSMLVSFVAAWFVQKKLGPPLVIDQEGQAMAFPWPDRRHRSLAILLIVSMLLAFSTAMLLLPGGLGSITETAVGWITLVSSSTGIETWLSMVLSLARYELPMIVLGIFALIWAIRRDEPLPLFLIYWLVGLVLLTLLQRGYLGNLAALLPAGYILTGWFVDDIFQAKTGPQKWSVAVGFAFAGGVIYINLARYGRLASFQIAATQTYHFFLIIITLLTIGLAATFIWKWNKDVAKQGIVAGLLVILTLYTWGAAWWLGRDGANDTRNNLVTSATDEEVRSLAETIEEISWQVTNSGKDLHIITPLNNPALAWYLRHLEHLQFDAALPYTVDSEALLTDSEYTPALESGYLGADFGYLHTNTPHRLTLNQALPWWLFHQSPIPINEERLVFWLRSDLAGS